MAATAGAEAPWVVVPSRPSAAGAGPGAAPAAAAAASGGLAKPLSLAAAHECVASLAALQSRLRDLTGRSQALQAALEARLGPEQRRRRQQAALAAAAAEAAACRQRAEQMQRQVEEVRAATVAARKVAVVRAQALVTTLKVMQAADRRVRCGGGSGAGEGAAGLPGCCFGFLGFGCSAGIATVLHAPGSDCLTLRAVAPPPPPPHRRSEAEAALRGEEGRGALAAALRELVARRCQMVCQLGAIFQLGPTPGERCSP